MVFLWFHHENRLVAHFCYHIRNQRVEIHKYTKFEENRRIQLFGTTPKFKELKNNKNRYLDILLIILCLLS